MNIIKPGDLGPSITYRGKCERCGCEVEVDEMETHEMRVGTTLSNMVRAVFCPTRRCYRSIKVYKEESSGSINSPS